MTIAEQSNKLDVLDKDVDTLKNLLTNSEQKLLDKNKTYRKNYFKKVNSIVASIGADLEATDIPNPYYSKIEDALDTLLTSTQYPNTSNNSYNFDYDLNDVIDAVDCGEDTVENEN